MSQAMTVGIGSLVWNTTPHSSRSGTGQRSALRAALDSASRLCCPIAGIESKRMRHSYPPDCLSEYRGGDIALVEVKRSDQVASEQRVAIEIDFLLVNFAPDDRQPIVRDDDKVDVTEFKRFTATAPDDNS